MFDEVKSASIAKIQAGHVPMAQLMSSRSHLKSVATSQLKRAVDFCLSLVAIIFLLPALVVISALIKLDSKGSVFFRQRRAGLNGTIFHIYKFRSMTVAEDGHNVRQAGVNDQRVTRIGRILRRTSLDELPQLINILKGDMSIVGPRPHALAHDQHFAAQIPSYATRLQARPGLTGLAQVRGFRGEVVTQLDLLQRVESDIEYIEKWTIMMDISIIMGTVPMIFGHKKAY